MLASTTVPVRITPEARARLADLGLEQEMGEMIDYARQHVPQPTRIEVVLYERDEPGELPGVAIEVYTQFHCFDPNAGTRGKIGEWLVSAFPAEVREHLLIDYLPEPPHAG